MLFGLGLLLLSGCGRGDNVAAALPDDLPAVSLIASLSQEEVPPPPPDSDVFSEEPSVMPQVPPGEILGDSWMDRQRQKAELLKGLREYAAGAAPGDPAALTEKEIEALSKLENIEFN